MYLPDIPKIFYLPEKEKHLDFRDLEVFFFWCQFCWRVTIKQPKWFCISASPCPQLSGLQSSQPLLSLDSDETSLAQQVELVKAAVMKLEARVGLEVDETPRLRNNEQIGKQVKVIFGNETGGEWLTGS